MNPTAQGIAQVMPTFVQGVQQLQNALISPAMLILLVGTILRFIASGSVRSMGLTIARLTIVILLIANITTISNQVQTIAQEATNASGFNQTQNMEQDYQTALTTKFKIPQQANSNPWQWFVNPLEVSGLTIFASAVYWLSLVACGVMFLVGVVQQILIYLEIAFAPMFLACNMVSVLLPIATRYATFFVSLCIWPLGFRVVDLLMKYVVDMAVNPSNNPVIATANALGGSMVWWIVAAVIGVFGYPFSAWIVSKAMVTGGSHGLGLMGPAVVASAFTALNMFNSASSAAARASGSSGSSGGGKRSVPPPLPMYKNYAVRP
jgi:hypothetical protein